MANTQKTDQGEFIKTEIYKYLSYWYLFVIGVVLALIVGFIYLRYTPKIYSSIAKIKILDKGKGLELPSAGFVFNRSNINLENEIEILKSYRIIEQVVENLELNMRFYEEGNVLTTEIDRLPFSVVKTIPNESTNWASYTIEITAEGFQIGRTGAENKQTFSKYSTLGTVHQLPFELNPEGRKDFSELIGKVYLIKFSPLESETRNLKYQLDINKQGKGSDLLELKFTSQSKSKNERIINELIRVFNLDGIEDRQDVSLRTMRFIDERFKLLVEELDSIETNIKTFKQNNNLISVETDAELGLTQRTESEAALFEIENQLLLADLLKESLKEGLTKQELLPANLGLSNTSINSAISDYNEVVLQLRELKTSAGANNPQVILLKQEMNDLQNNIISSLEAYDNQLNVTKSQLDRKNQRFSAKVYSIPTKEKVLLDIKRQQQIKQTLYIFLLQKREEAAINFAITEPTIKVVEYALSSGGPISPIPRKIYLTALIVGLIIPLAGIYGFNFMNTKVKTKADLINNIGAIPILAELPSVKGTNLLFENPLDRSVQAEAFRILSANVEYILPASQENRNNGKVVYCTSTIKGEGKTYVAMNLSLALSSINKKVLLIGADLRNPQIHSYISRDKNHKGLSDYLYDDSSEWESSRIKGYEKHPNHDILLAGSIPPNPTQLLTNGRFEKLLDDAKLIYDYILIDTAPTIPVTDTLLIAKYADATLYVVRADYTEKKLLEFSKNLNDSEKVKNMAYVLNGVGAKRSYGDSYNYGYGYGYGNQGIKPKKKGLFNR